MSPVFRGLPDFLNLLKIWFATVKPAVPVGNVTEMTCARQRSGQTSTDNENLSFRLIGSVCARKLCPDCCRAATCDGDLPCTTEKCHGNGGLEVPELSEWYCSTEASWPGLVS